jgi:peptidoglycan-associated lipoprotein
MRNFGTFASALIAAGLLAACSSTPIAPAAPTPAPAATSTAPVAPAKPVAPAISAVAPVTVAPYLDPQSPISRDRSVYFDFDQYTIKADGTRTVELHGKYLSANPGVKIRIEGNTDDLGGKEYNLALGQKRSEAVAKSLKVFGVTDAQMEAVSLGEEKPKATGTDDAARAQNRRADIAYPAK